MRKSVATISSLAFCRNAFFSGFGCLSSFIDQHWHDEVDVIPGAVGQHGRRVGSIQVQMYTGSHTDGLQPLRQKDGVETQRKGHDHPLEYRPAFATVILEPAHDRAFC